MSQNRLHLLLSSPPDAMPYGLTTAKRELTVVQEMPQWNLHVDHPDILMNLDISREMPDVLPLYETYRATLGDSLRFGAWAHLDTKRPLLSYLKLGRLFTQFCTATKTPHPTLFLSSQRAKPFTLLDATLPIGLGALSQSLPPETCIYLYSPATADYVLMASILQIPCVDKTGAIRLITGDDALQPRAGSHAKAAFLAPWWNTQ